MKREHFISPDALEKRLGENRLGEKRPGGNKLSIICNYMFMPAENRDGAAEFANERIPGAVFFDIDKIADQSSSLPHMLARPEQFSRQMGELGVSEDDEIVIYDGPGLFSSARIWWNLRIMGATNLRILEGGFKRWKRENRPIDNSPPKPPQPAKFVANFDAERVFTSTQVQVLINSKKGTILDARSAPRYEGSVEEPRPGLRLGHMPGATCLPFTDLIEDGTLIDNNRLRDTIQPLLSNGDPIVTTCGSGVTAAVLSLTLTCAGYDSHVLFDGSWTEWGDPDKDYPIISGGSGSHG